MITDVGLHELGHHRLVPGGDRDRQPAPQPVAAPPQWRTTSDASTATTPLPVKRVVQETADTRSFVLDVPDDLRDTFRYRPGQFCTFRVHLGDDEHLRSYSMSSAPETDDDLTVTVKRVPGGLVSNWFNDEVGRATSSSSPSRPGVFCVRDGDPAGGRRSAVGAASPR